MRDEDVVALGSMKLASLVNQLAETLIQVRQAPVADSAGCRVPDTWNAMRWRLWSEVPVHAYLIRMRDKTLLKMW